MGKKNNPLSHELPFTLVTGGGGSSEAGNWSERWGAWMSTVKPCTASNLFRKCSTRWAKIPNKFWRDKRTMSCNTRSTWQRMSRDHDLASGSGNSLWGTSAFDYKHASGTNYARKPRFYCRLLECPLYGGHRALGSLSPCSQPWPFWAYATRCRTGQPAVSFFPTQSHQRWLLNALRAHRLSASAAECTSGATVSGSLPAHSLNELGRQWL